MLLPVLFAKLHRARVTGADLNYEGSIAIDSALLEASGIRPLQKVEIYNINNGERFATYVIGGVAGQIELNGAAARRVQRDDLVIICAYAQVNAAEIESHTATVLLLGDDNRIERTLKQSVAP